MDVFAVPKRDNGCRGDERHAGDGCRAGQKLAEREAGFVADVDAHRVAEHGGGRPDVRTEDRHQDKGCGADFQRVADLEDEGQDHDDGDLVDDAGERRGESAQNQGKRGAGHPLLVEDRLDHPGEEAEVLERADDDHHADQKEDDVELRGAEHAVEVIARDPMSTATPRKATATRWVQKKKSVVQITPTKVQTATTGRGPGAMPTRLANQPSDAVMPAMRPIFRHV